jgi:sugar phosphate isomerase/epimerase
MASRRRARVETGQRPSLGGEPPWQVGRSRLECVPTRRNRGSREGTDASKTVARVVRWSAGAVLTREGTRELAQLSIAVRLSTIAPQSLSKLQAAPLRAAFATASRIGASAVQIDARNDIRPSELSATGLRQLRKMLDDFNLRVASVRFQTRRGYDSPEDLSRRIDATKEAMEMAYKLGAGLVINQIGNIPEKEDDPRYQTLAAVMSDLGRHGAHVGAFFAAETGTDQGEKLAKLLETDNAAYVAVALNPGKLIINRFSVPETIKAIGNRIRTLIAVDGVVDLAAGRGITVPVGQGTADFPSILAHLEDFQFAGHVVVGDEERNANSLANAADAVQYLKNL